MRASIHFWSCLVQVFLEWEMFGTKVVEKIETNFIFLISNFRRVSNLLCTLLGVSPASNCCMPTFRNPLSVPSSGKHPKEYIINFIFTNFFPPKILPFMRMWENVVEPGMPQMTIWCLRIPCWIPKGTSTHSEYVILIAFPPQQWLHELPSMLRYTHIDCLLGNAFSLYSLCSTVH